MWRIPEPAGLALTRGWVPVFEVGSAAIDAFAIDELCYVFSFLVRCGAKSNMSAGYFFRYVAVLQFPGTTLPAVLPDLAMLSGVWLRVASEFGAGTLNIPVHILVEILASCAKAYLLCPSLCGFAIAEFGCAGFPASLRI